jgi:imidazolonepropionase-like amidohydrolase
LGAADCAHADTAIGKQGDKRLGGARRAELPGLTLLPGLIDMHVCLTDDPRYSGYRGLEFTDNFWTFIGLANAKTIERTSLAGDEAFVMKGGAVVKVAGGK